MRSSYEMDPVSFDTERFHVGAWHGVAVDSGLDVAQVVADVLSVRTTASLPPQWHGDYDLPRAAAFVAERDDESPTLLAVERGARNAVALVILFEDGGDLRIGYIVDEQWWGRGVASELVAGLVGWAHTQPMVASLSGGVAPDNAASIRVLVKNGFEVAEHGEHEVLYRRVLSDADS